MIPRPPRCDTLWGMPKLVYALAVALSVGPSLVHAQETPKPQEYVLGPDSQRQPGVPQETVTKH